MAKAVAEVIVIVESLAIVVGPTEMFQCYLTAAGGKLGWIRNEHQPTIMTQWKTFRFIETSSERWNMITKPRANFLVVESHSKGMVPSSSHTVA